MDGRARPVADVIVVNCGELVRASKKRKKEEKEEETESSGEGEEKKKHKKKRKRKKAKEYSDSSSESEAEDAEKENNTESAAVSTVKKEDLPPEPKNAHAFLMRRSRTPEEKRKEKVR